MGRVEAELRSFITKEKYESLLEFFNSNAMLVSTDDQETHYFDAPADIRLQKNSQYSKIWLKKGNMHDDAREEITVNFNREDFGKLSMMFSEMGYETKIKWFRKRHKFEWKGFTVCLDSNRGYGYIFEIEKMTTIQGKGYALLEIQKLFDELDLTVTPRNIFDEKYREYVRNWKELAK